MSESFKLDATVRDVVGKKVGRYRRAGQIPAVLYGPDFTPLNIFINEPDLRQVLGKAGGTHLIELQIGQDSIPALAREVQRDSVRGSLMHVDFYRVAMDRVIHTEVPVVLVGTSPAIARKEAIAIHPTNMVLIECLPADLPANIEVDISELANIGDQILVGDLKLPAAVKVLTAIDDLIVKLDYAEALAPAVEEEVVAPVSAEVEVITARKPEEEEGEAESV